MSYFTQSGDCYIPTAGRQSLLGELPAGNYYVVSTQQGMFYQRTDSFKDEGRIYGNIDNRAQRIMRTFLDRTERSTGVLLSGEKGSGKSLLARNISRLGYDAGIPTILINAPFHGDEFNALLAAVEQPAIVLMDEFEKVYRDQKHQEAVLTLLDGVMTTQKLFVLTVNDKYRVNHNMTNRPGRLYYALEFDGLATEFIREYCDDNLSKKDDLDSVINVSAMFQAFNFDMLKAMVEEMNRYGENAFEVMELLNTKPLSLGSNEVYDVVVLTKSGHQSEVIEFTEIPISGGTSDGRDYVMFTARFPSLPEDDDDDESLPSWEHDLLNGGERKSGRHEYITVRHSDLNKIDARNGRYRFITESGMTIDFTRKERQQPTNRFEAF